MLQRLNRKTAGIQKKHPIRVIQFGGGNFLRGFADWIIDVMNETQNFDSGVQVILSVNKAMASALHEQDGLYHLALKGIQNGSPYSETRLISCIQDAIDPHQDYSQFLAAGHNPDLQFMISNTTESGISFDPTDRSPESLPRTFPGKLTALLYERFQHFEASADKGLILLPCELIEKNGDTLRQVILQYARHWNLPSEFDNWIQQHNHFCNTLVDRIVPGFSKEALASFQQESGYYDTLAVMAEPFHLWVCQGSAFAEAKFPAANAGLNVKFVTDLTPYRTTKVRILNGAHTSLLPVAYLGGFRAVKESVEDPALNAFLKETIFREIIPALPLEHGQLVSFANATLERFLNPFIHHELKSIALNSISKFKVRVLPSLLEYNKANNSLPHHLVFSFACLLYFYKGAWRDEKLPVNDSPEVISFLNEVWQTNDPKTVAQQTLSQVSLWGQDLTLIPGLSAELGQHLRYIQQVEQNALLSWPMPL